jgi:hypothetical protein
MPMVYLGVGHLLHLSSLLHSYQILTFFIKGDRHNNFGLFVFQAHLRFAYELFPLNVVAYVPPFMQLAKRGSKHFKQIA